MSLLVTLLAISITLALAEKNHDGNILFFRQKSSGDNEGPLLMLTWEEEKDKINAQCTFLSEQDDIEEVLKSFNDPHVYTVSDADMEELLGECDSVDRSTGMREEEDENEIQKASGRGSKTKTTKSGSETTTAGYDGIPVIFPGTKWCGAGDRAKNYDDLGLHQDTDRCCRAHDLCNDTLAPGETRNDLTNKSPFTKLSCQCDNDFYSCLDRVNSVTSNTIGNMYFNILKRECYKEDYPLTDKCKKYRTFLKLKCKEYEKDTKGKKVYQWVPAKKYKKIPFPGPLTITLPNIPF